MKADVLVTGGCGFIGSAIARAWVARGQSVRVLDDLSTGSLENLTSIREGIDWIRGDVRDPAVCRQACRGTRIVFHQAALPSVLRSIEDPATTHEVNVNGSLNMLLAARDAGVERFVFASSSSVYGDTEWLPKKESDPVEPLSPYALSKLTGEHYVRLFHRLYGLTGFSLRYFNVFGPRQDPDSPYAAVIPSFVRALRENRPLVIHGDGRQTRDFTYIDDVVAANLACAAAPASAGGRTYNIAAGKRTSILDLGQALCAAMERPFDPRYGDARPGDVRDSQADAAAAREVLGWEAKAPLEVGLRHTVEWFTRKECGDHG